MKLVADANVLLAALAGGRTQRILDHPDVEEIFAPHSVVAEVYEYIPKIAQRKKLEVDTLLLTLATLPIILVDRQEYELKIPEATKRIGKRDPDDVDALALALHLDIPVWSNDNDFEEAGIEWYTTAELLKKLMD